jgi:hypothetical protein
LPDQFLRVHELGRGHETGTERASKAALRRRESHAGWVAMDVSTAPWQAPPRIGDRLAIDQGDAQELALGGALPAPGARAHGTLVIVNGDHHPM